MPPLNLNGILQNFAEVFFYVNWNKMQSQPNWYFEIKISHSNFMQPTQCPLWPKSELQPAIACRVRALECELRGLRQKQSLNNVRIINTHTNDMVIKWSSYYQMIVIFAITWTGCSWSSRSSADGMKSIFPDPLASCDLHKPLEFYSLTPGAQVAGGEMFTVMCTPRAHHSSVSSLSRC